MSTFLRDADELPGPDATVIYTRQLTVDDLPGPQRLGAIAYVCGSSGFADAATGLLVASGVPAGAIRVERFGPTGTPG